LVTINPLDVILWTLRRNEKDVVNLYDSLSPLMQIATGGSMLNFGYWSEKTKDPISAQKNLCDYFGKIAELKDAATVMDLGSGLSAPAIFWQEQYVPLHFFCVNINYKQLQFAGSKKNIEFINSTATNLPFSGNSLDRIVALESSQHFRPFEKFLSESLRVLKKDGIFVIGLPVILSSTSKKNLGILKFTWSSEHYELDFVKDSILSKGFCISEEHLIGKNVYDPLAGFYLENRENLRKSIKQKYPDFVEKILYKSIQKMRKASEDKIIEYAILKCHI
jgi:ubiquinone/menaquinone biosynthesis C-methylase UbiE